MRCTGGFVDILICSSSHITDFAFVDGGMGCKHSACALNILTRDAVFDPDGCEAVEVRGRFGDILV